MAINICDPIGFMFACFLLGFFVTAGGLLAFWLMTLCGISVATKTYHINPPDEDEDEEVKQS